MSSISDFARIPTTALLLLCTLASCAQDTQLDSSLEGSETPSESLSADWFVPNSSGGGRLSASDFSHIGEPIINVMLGLYSDSEGVLWGASADNAVGAEWLLQTPHIWHQPAGALVVADSCDADEAGCDPDFLLPICETQADCGNGGVCQSVQATVRTPGGAPTALCVGHSADLWQAHYDAVVQAERFVDVSVLEPPDGRFTAALRNAITYLDRSDRDVEVRLLFGHTPVPGHSTDVVEIVRDMTEYLGDDTRLRVSVGAYRSGIPARNHTKIIAVDGRILIQGGHNFWTDIYLRQNPIFDLSMQIEGSAAVDGHMILNRLWDYTCGPSTLVGHSEYVQFPYEVELCPEAYTADGMSPAAGDTRVISVSRLANLGDNPSDDAITTMLSAARDSIRLSIQDIGPISLGPITTAEWPEPILAELGWAVARGVDVYLALSSPGVSPGGRRLIGMYGNGWTPGDVAEKVQEWLEDNPYVFDDTNLTARELVCAHFHPATLRFSDDDTWADGTNIGNHTKLMIVDDVAFYLGAQNLFPSNNAEFGLIVDDRAVTERLLDEYWNPLWEHSGRTAVSGREAPNCAY